MINDIKEEMDIPHVDSCAWNLLLIGYLENRIEKLEKNQTELLNILNKLLK